MKTASKYTTPQAPSAKEACVNIDNSVVTWGDIPLDDFGQDHRTRASGGSGNY